MAIHQTKFWPKYERDKVYMRSTSHASSSASMEGSAVGSSSGGASGQFFSAGDWLGPELSGTSSISSYGSSQMSHSGSSYSDTDSETVGEADIPIFRPVPFTELSSIEHYTLDEQLTELTAALKRQFQRHCFIEIHEQEAQPMLVPFVREYYTRPSNQKWYIDKVLAEHQALPAADADRLIEEREAALLKEVNASRVTAPLTTKETPQTQATPRPKKTDREKVFADIINPAADKK